MASAYIYVANNDKEQMKGCMEIGVLGTESEDENELVSNDLENAGGAVSDMIQKHLVNICVLPPFTYFCPCDWDAQGCVGAFQNGVHVALLADSEGTPYVAYRETGPDALGIKTAEKYYELKRDIEIYQKLRG